MAHQGTPPMANTSDKAFAAAICPNRYGSLTMGVKKSRVCTSAFPSGKRSTAASSLSDNPAITLSSKGRAGTADKTRSRTSGANLDAQPEALILSTKVMRPFFALTGLSEAKERIASHPYKECSPLSATRRASRHSRPFAKTNSQKRVSTGKALRYLFLII